ncbi:MAG: hypothetical protein IPK83_03485 [Planctomycetes bacterium]|nr:hypothetical protein [Planctomycetota bacterium]
MDRSTNTIDIVGDRYGRYLTYYARVGRTVIFAGQIKAILATGLIPATLNEDALGLMMLIGEVVGEMTLFDGIFAIPSAAIARIDSKGLGVRKYWHYKFAPKSGLEFTKSAERAGALLRQGVSRVCVSHARLGVPLSGGLDSRVLLASCPNPSQIRSYTWGIKGCRDLRYARRVAMALQSPHDDFEYDPNYLEGLANQGVWLTEGLCDVADMHVLPYVQYVGSQTPVILDGFAGDVLLGGNFIKHDWWKATSTSAAAIALWQWRFGMMPPDLGVLLLGQSRYRSLLERSRSLWLASFERYASDDSMSSAMGFLHDNRMRRCSSGGTHLFRWRAELHSPFYDNELFDHIANVPHAWRHRHRLYIEMIRRSFPSTAGIPWQRTGLPARTRWPGRFLSAGAHRLNEWAGANLRFPDVFASRHVCRLDLWFRGPLRPFIQRILLSESFLSRGIALPDGVRMVLRNHHEGANHTKLIGVLVALELFHRLFVDDFTASIGKFGFETECLDRPTDSLQLKSTE